MIGRQRTKERSIDLKKDYIRKLEECVWSISSNKIKNEAEIIKVEEDYLERILQQEQERRLAELRRKSEQAFWASPSTQAHFRREYSHFHPESAWDC